MKEEIIQALAHYGRIIREGGWQAGEPLIVQYAEQFTDFKRWAHAFGIMLRAKEILEEETVG